ncbi:MAG: AI-2E family transporter [Bifidobacteriaceae bacterium]|jgi:predicted PurR-regulated permease PerM|nr:AI-2E family transporter [Bifidobacteriaceae bacterium]
MNKKTFEFWFTGLVLIICVFLIYLAQTPLIMILTAAFFAVLLNRPIDYLTRFLKKKALSLLLVFAIVIAVFFVLFITVVPTLADGIKVFTNTLPTTVAQLQGTTEPLFAFLTNHGLDSVYFQAVESFKMQMSNIALGFLSGFGAAALALTNAFLVLVMTAFFVLEGPIWIEKYFKWFYTEDKKRKYHRMVLNKLYFEITGYITASFIVACVQTGFAVLGLLILAPIMGFSSSLVWPVGMIIFITSFIPMFGGLIGGILSFILIGLYNPLAALIYVIYLLVYQQIINNIALPKIFAKYINVSPLVVLVSMVLGTYIGGILGMLVAIPFAACVQTIAQEFFYWRSQQGKSQSNKKSVKPAKTSKNKNSQK